MAIKQAPKAPNSTDMTLDEFKEWLKGFDTDKDGKVSLEELRQAVRQARGWFSSKMCGRRIRAADSNGDGYVDDDETANLVAFAKKYLGVRIVG